jgi:hypothetical protein
MNQYKVQIFPETVNAVGAGMGSRIFPDLKSAEAYRQELVASNSAKDSNIGIDEVDADGRAVFKERKLKES